MSIENEEYLTLKWGSLKSWNLKSEKCKELVRRYLEIGASYSAMAQNDTPEQRKIICDLIDAVDGEIQNDWSGKILTKEEAKEYVMTYGE